MNKTYSARALLRMADEPGTMHNFPGLFDETVFSQDTRTVNPGYFNKAEPNLSNDSRRQGRRRVHRAVVGIVVGRLVYRSRPTCPACPVRDLRDTKSHEGVRYGARNSVPG